MSQEIDHPAVRAMYRHHEVSQFLNHEAALLDEQKFDQWLALFTPDVHYWMPIRRTVSLKDRAREFTAPDQMNYINDNHAVLSMRVKRLKTGYSWSEDPPSRTQRLITNVRIVAEEGDELAVDSAFILQRTRFNSEETRWVGKREDRLRWVDGSLRIARRKIILGQTVILASNLSCFF